MNNTLAYFQHYSAQQAPFMHKQYADWSVSRPLAGLRVIHNIPLVPNTLLKIACVVAAGAEVIVTNPNFLTAHTEAVNALLKDGIEYVDDIARLTGIKADLYFDCGAELLQKLGPPKLGAIELTASGDTYYRQHAKDFPVISIDPTYTKQLETVFGSAESANVAIAHLVGNGIDVAKKSWLVFGFGKIGRGLAYYCSKNLAPVTVADIDPAARESARQLGLSAIDPEDIAQLELAIKQADIIITSSGKADIMQNYPKQWFQNKILANMGILDEYGSQFTEGEVLNKKLPINFILHDPTPMKFIDPEFFAHNIAALQLLKSIGTSGVTDLDSKLDFDIIENWCAYHQLSKQEIDRWFVKIN